MTCVKRKTLCVYWRVENGFWVLMVDDILDDEFPWLDGNGGEEGDGEGEGEGEGERL